MDTLSDKIREAATCAPNYDLDTEAILTQLQQWQSLCVFHIVEAGGDRIAIVFETLPENMDAFVRSLYDFCPDLVDQGTGCVAEFIEEMETIPPNMQALIEGIDFEDPDYGLEILKRGLQQDKKVLLWWD